jgi:predicted Zn finger-like uncharacterized protein
MRVTCPTCEATYKVGDERIAGKVVKIRCKRCTTVIVVDGLAKTGQQPIGRRNEESVLFSLSMLAPQVSTPVAAAAEPSGLIDIRALAIGSEVRAPKRCVDVGDGLPTVDFATAFAPVFAPPVLEVTPPKPASKSPWVAVGFGAFAAVGVLLGVGLAQHRNATVAAVPLIERPSSDQVARPQEAPSDDAPLPIVSSASPTQPIPTRKNMTPEPIASVTVRTTSSFCCSGESETACAMRRSVGATCEGHELDRAAATHALEAVSLASCRGANSPNGQGHVVVTLQPSGAASNADVDAPPFAGTDTGRCIARAYRGVHVPAFTGASVTVGKRFTL